MMPLALVDIGTECMVHRVTGPDATRKHLEDLGFNPGEIVIVVAQLNGNIIVKVKESRIALDQDLAKKIMV